MTLDQFRYAVKQSRKRSEPWAKEAVLCQHCAGSLVASKALVAASSHCGHCGGRVIDENKYSRLTPEEAANLPTAQEFIAASRPYILTSKLIGAIGGVAIVLGVVSVMGVGRQLLVRNDLWAPWVEHVLAAWTFCGLPFLFVVAIVLVEMRARANPTIRCQNCLTVLAYTLPLVVPMRRCPACGEQHLRDNAAPLDGSTAPLVTLSEYLRDNVALLDEPTTSVVTLSVYLSRGTSTTRCPHCRKKPHAIDNVIASMHCDRCGGRVIADPVAGKPVPENAP